MICPICAANGIQLPMTKEEGTEAYNDPGEEYGFGERTYTFWLCEECGNEEEYEE